MALRRPLVAANWKMHKTAAEAAAFVAVFRAAGGEAAGIEVVLCPPFTALDRLAGALQGTALYLGGQNLHTEAQGAFTGEVSGPMLGDLGCRYVIVGHSERRQLCGETDELIQKKMAVAAASGLRPILCVGETLAERAGGRTEWVIHSQLTAALAGLAPAEMGGLVVAYEPVWAIGSGRAASPADAQWACALLRMTLAEALGPAAADSVRLLYGGSVKAANVAGYTREADVDGALVGGASLDPVGFAELVQAVARG